MSSHFVLKSYKISGIPCAVLFLVLFLGHWGKSHKEGLWAHIVSKNKSKAKFENSLFHQFIWALDHLKTDCLM